MISIDGSKEGKLKIVDQVGRIVLCSDFVTGEPLNTENLSEGAYIMKILVGEKSYAAKLLIRR